MYSTVAVWGGGSPRTTDEEEKQLTALAWKQVARARGQEIDSPPHPHPGQPRPSDTPPQGLLPPSSGSVLGRHCSRGGPATHRQGDHSSVPAERRQDGGDSSPSSLENALDTFSMTAG